MKRLSLVLLLSLSLSALAGNGVERGSVMIRGVHTEETPTIEVTNFLKKILVKCAQDKDDEYFEVAETDQFNQTIDNGIVDFRYRFKLLHWLAGKLQNSIVVDMLDSDYDNWRKYEEKISGEITYDEKRLCKK